MNRLDRGTATPRDLEVARFWSHVTKGPTERDCWIWTGAIADDGYGRFWVATSEGERVVRPHRYAYALASGLHIDVPVVVEHVRCDNPVCVRADGTVMDHIAASTQRANLARMGARKRGGGHSPTFRHRASDRESLALRSRALREAVRDGWDEDRIAAAIESTMPAQMRLW